MSAAMLQGGGLAIFAFTAHVQEPVVKFYINHSPEAVLLDQQ